MPQTTTTRDPLAQPEPTNILRPHENAAKEHYSRLTELTTDPDFQALPVAERAEVLTKYMQQLGTNTREFHQDQTRLDKSTLDESGAVSRGFSGIGRMLASIPSGVFHAVADEPTKAEESGAFDPKFKGPIPLALKRLLYDSQNALQRRSAEREKRGDKAGSRADRLLGDIPLAGPFANSLAERAGSGDVSGAITEGGTALALPKLPKLLKAGGAAALEHYASAYRPIVLDIEGIKVPMLQSEAAPETSVGHVVRDFKRAGVGEKHFEKFAQGQQQAVKAVIRKVAAKTSNAVAPMPESGAGALATAANAVEATAKPMYQALDASLTSVPSMLDATAKVVQKAIGDAEKLGVSVGDLDPQISPTKPFATYQTLRSRLLQHARSSSDPAVRAEIFRHVDTIDSSIERGFSSKPELLENYKEANRLWRKMYALREVAEAIDASTKGSPEEVQRSLADRGVSAVPPEMQGGQMVKRLNDLATRNHGASFIERAFDETPEGRGHAMAIRQVAEILNRAEQAGSSNLVGTSTKYSLMWKLLKKIGGGRLAQAMTTPKGAQAILNTIKANTPVMQAKTIVRHSPDIEDAFEEARRGGPGDAPKVEVDEKTRASVSDFAKQARDRVRKPSGATQEAEAPPTSSEEAGGSGSTAGADGDTADFKQAKKNLPNGTLSEWLREAQRIKDERGGSK